MPAELAAELESYPCPDSAREPELEPEPEPANEIMMPLRLRGPGGLELSFFSIVATFGTPLDVTLSELAIGAFSPADDTTAAYLRLSGHRPK